MACALRKDPGSTDILAKPGQSATLFIEVDAPGGTDTVNITISAAELRPPTDPTPEIIDDSKVKVTIPLGFSTLAMTMEGIPNGAKARLKEDCGDGTSQTLLKITLSVNEPLLMVQFNAQKSHPQFV